MGHSREQQVVARLDSPREAHEERGVHAHCTRHVSRDFLLDEERGTFQVCGHVHDAIKQFIRL